MIDPKRITKVAVIEITKTQADSLISLGLTCAHNEHGDHFVDVDTVLETDFTPKWVSDICQEASDQEVGFLLMIG